MKTLNVVVAGSSSYTALVLSGLLNHPHIKVAGLISKRNSPLLELAVKEDLPIVEVGLSLQEEKQNILKLKRPDILLVMDFGFLIKDWLLEWPKIAPVNLHPSLLPAWRGSSPGQFVLLFGQEKSGLSLIKMDTTFDTGKLIYQEEFPLDPSWTAADYYLHAFGLAKERIADVLHQFSAGELTPKKQPQKSPSPLARKLFKDDGFIDFEVIKKLMSGKTVDSPGETGVLLSQAKKHLHSWPQVVETASRALFPWPGLWTKIKTKKGEKIMKILAVNFEEKKLTLKKVQIEGYQIATFNQVKNLIEL